MPRAATAVVLPDEIRLGMPTGYSLGEASAEDSITRIFEKSAPSTGTGSSDGRKNCMPKVGAVIF
ncbi:hypothetical protein D3C71_2168070 [compost metagenome]